MNQYGQARVHTEIAFRALVVVLLAGCGGSGGAAGESGRPEPTEPTSAWPQDFENSMCAATDHMRLEVLPAIDEFVSAVELEDTQAAIDASDRIEDGAAQVLDDLDPAPAWEPGAASIEHLTQWMTLLESGSNQVSSGLSNNDTAMLEAGFAEVGAGADKGVTFNAELQRMQGATGFVCP